MECGYHIFNRLLDPNCGINIPTDIILYCMNDISELNDVSELKYSF